jgi:serine/threonine protein kinase
MQDAAQILADVSDTLSYIHAQGIQHNDLKAPNILITGEIGHFRAILCDVGHASEVSRVEYGGTPFYIAPEVYTGAKRDDYTDMFALGMVTLYLAKRVQCPDPIVPPWNIKQAMRGEGSAILRANEYLQHMERVRKDAQLAIKDAPQPEKTLLRCATAMASPVRLERGTASDVHKWIQAVITPSNAALQFEPHDEPLAIAGSTTSTQATRADSPDGGNEAAYKRAADEVTRKLATRGARRSQPPKSMLLTQL